MKKVIFVNPPNDLKKSNNFSNGLFSLATILKNKGYLVRVIDLDYIITEAKINISDDINYNIEEMCNYIMKNSPDLVSFYTMSNSYYITLKLSEKLRSKNENLKIVFGGPQATLTAEKTLKMCSWIDAIGIGEGERSIINIVETLLNGKRFNNDLGVAYLDGDEVIQNHPLLIEDLDELPKYDYSLLEGSITGKISLDVGRGCPFGCKYCSTKTFWKRKFRLKSSVRIIDEIIECKERFNINDFNFEHDLFTVNKKKVMDFCNQLIERNIKISWGCSSRIDTLDEELIKKMKEAGCRGIFLGVETGSRRMQKVINKNLNLDNSPIIINLLRKYGIEIVASFIYGFPEETEQDVAETLELIYKMKIMGIKKVQLHLFSIFPGTEYYDQLEEELYLSNSFSDGASSGYIDVSNREFIKENKSIFPQYLDFNLGIRQELKFLDVYIYANSYVFMNYMNRTYNTLLDIFGGHLEVFKRFREINISYLEKYENLIHKLILDPKESISLIENLINVINHKDKDIVKEVFNFESDIVNFIYYSKEIELVNNYKYDVYSVKKNGLASKYKNLETKISFQRLNKRNDINIKVV